MESSIRTLAGYHEPRRSLSIWTSTEPFVSWFHMSVLTSCTGDVVVEEQEEEERISSSGCNGGTDLTTPSSTQPMLIIIGGKPHAQRISKANT